MGRCAIIDLGSNTIRLVVYAVEANSFTTLVNESAFLGIIRYVNDGVLSDEGLERIVDSLEEFTKLASLLDCERQFCFATASLRGIKNADYVCRIVQERTGVQVLRLSGEEEAKYDSLGLLCAKPQLADAVGCDVGGGSGQIFVLQQKELTQCVSLPIGCLKLYNDFVKGLLPRKSEAQRLYRHAKELLRQAPLKKAQGELLYAMGGTARAMAKLHRSMVATKMPVQDYQVDVEDINVMIATIRNMGMEGIKLLNKVIPERAHTIIPGMLVLKAIAKTMGVKNIQIVRTGVREGFLTANVLGASGTPLAENRMNQQGE